MAIVGTLCMPWKHILGGTGGSRRLICCCQDSFITSPCNCWICRCLLAIVGETINMQPVFTGQENMAVILASGRNLHSWLYLAPFSSTSCLQQQPGLEALGKIWGERKRNFFAWVCAGALCLCKTHRVESPASESHTLPHTEDVQSFYQICLLQFKYSLLGVRNLSNCSLAIICRFTDHFRSRSYISFSFSISCFCLSQFYQVHFLIHW